MKIVYKAREITSPNSLFPGRVPYLCKVWEQAVSKSDPIWTGACLEIANLEKAAAATPEAAADLYALRVVFQCIGRNISGLMSVFETGYLATDRGKDSGVTVDGVAILCGDYTSIQQQLDSIAEKLAAIPNKGKRS
jgi:hypothetical protein